MSKKLEQSLTETHRVIMPTDKALEYLTALKDYTNAKLPDPGFAIALSMAIDCMNRAAHEDNAPLKLEELREMSNTDWVWVVFPGLDKSENCWYRAKKLFDLYSHEHYGKTWLAYRRPPERGEE